MANERSLPLLLAVTRETDRLNEANPRRQANGGNIVRWPTVAAVMDYLQPGCGWTKDTTQKTNKRAERTMSPEGITALIAGVDRALYADAVAHAHERGARPAGKPSVVPGVTAEDKPKKEYVPPPLRSNDPRERVEARKDQILREHDRKVATKLVEQQSLTELLVDAVERGAQTAPPVIWRPAPMVLMKPDACEEVPVALLSDIHGGTMVDPEEMGGLGEFNFEIFKRRLNNYQERIAGAIDLHRRDNPIRKMVVYMLGDMIEGEVIFDGQAFRIELIVTDQLFEVAAYVMGWLQGILATGLVDEIHCVCIWGNHGRTTHKKGASKGHSNWDFVLYKHMAAVLANETRIKWFIPKAWFALVDVLGWKIYGTHGDAVKSWVGIPFYGIQRHDMRTTTLLQSVGESYNYMVYGDKHITATIPRVSGAQIMNGSIVGGSDFSMHLLGTASEPMQTLFGINERHGKTWQYDFVLDRRDPEEIRKHLALTQV